MTPLRLLLLASLLGAPWLSAQQKQGTQLKIAGPTTYVRIDTVGTWVLVPGSTAKVFQAAADAYQSLKVKTDLVDSLAGQIGSIGFTQSGSFAGNRMSAWIRCGDGITGPNADQWRVSMAILSGLERVTKDTTRIRTVVVATARNMTGGASPPMMCVTTGGLEERINMHVLAFASGDSGKKGN
jgi:hypothetical protein